MAADPVRNANSSPRICPQALQQMNAFNPLTRVSGKCYGPTQPRGINGPWADESDAKPKAMIVRTLACLSDAGLTALALFDLRHVLREGLLSRVSPPPEVRPVVVSARDSAARTDLYLPGRAGQHGGLVLVPGFTELGKDDPRIVWLAHFLARIGFVVLVPDLLGLRSLQARETDVGDMVDSFRFLASQVPRVRPDRVGIMGISYGAGPALIAAADPSIADRVRFVISFGGYFDLVDVIRFVTTGHFAWQDHHGHIPPSPHARGRFLLANLDLARDLKDRKILEMAARKLLASDVEDPAPRIADLTPWGAALYALLMNADPARVEPLIAQLDPRVRERIAFLSPSRVVENLKAHLIIIHGRRDDFIPYTESLRLAAAAPAKDRLHLAITRLITHVDVTGPDLNSKAGLGMVLPDLWKVFRVVQFAVAQRN